MSADYKNANKWPIATTVDFPVLINMKEYQRRNRSGTDIVQEIAAHGNPASFQGLVCKPFMGWHTITIPTVMADEFMTAFEAACRDPRSPISMRQVVNLYTLEQAAGRETDCLSFLDIRWRVRNYDTPWYKTPVVTALWSLVKTVGMVIAVGMAIMAALYVIALFIGLLVGVLGVISSGSDHDRDRR